MSVFGKRLKAERELKKASDPKWTQGYVAELIGVARSSYTAYENGTKEPPRDTINKIADTFDVSIDYLEGRTNIKKYERQHIADSEIYIAYLGGPPKELNEEEAYHLEKELEEFRKFKARRQKEREEQDKNL